MRTAHLISIRVTGLPLGVSSGGVPLCTHVQRPMSGGGAVCTLPCDLPYDAFDVTYSRTPPPPVNRQMPAKTSSR